MTPGAIFGESPIAEWPLIVGDYKLFIPDNGSNMEFTLKDVRLYKAGSRGARFPNPVNFERPDAAGTDLHEEKY